MASEPHLGEEKLGNSHENLGALAVSGYICSIATHTHIYTDGHLGRHCGSVPDHYVKQVVNFGRFPAHISYVSTVRYCV